MRGRGIFTHVTTFRALGWQMLLDTFSYVGAPGRLTAEERWQWRSSPVAFLAPHAGGTHFRCPWTPVQLRSSELPATTVEESSRGSSLRNAKQDR